MNNLIDFAKIANDYIWYLHFLLLFYLKFTMYHVTISRYLIFLFNLTKT